MGSTASVREGPPLFYTIIKLSNAISYRHLNKFISCALKRKYIKCTQVNIFFKKTIKKDLSYEYNFKWPLI